MLAGPEVAAPTCFYVILLFHQMHISPPFGVRPLQDGDILRLVLERKIAHTIPNRGVVI